MDYLIIYNDEPIGRVIEPGADFSMGVVHGPFEPFPAYEKVRPVFRIYAELVDPTNCATRLGNQEAEPYRMGAR